MDDDTVLLTTKQAAKELDVSVSTLQKWARKKQVPHYKLANGQLVFDKQTLHDWIMCG